MVLKMVGQVWKWIQMCLTILHRPIPMPVWCWKLNQSRKFYLKKEYNWVVAITSIPTSSSIILSRCLFLFPLSSMVSMLSSTHEELTVSPASFLPAISFTPTCLFLLSPPPLVHWLNIHRLIGSQYLWAYLFGEWNFTKRPEHVAGSIPKNHFGIPFLKKTKTNLFKGSLIPYMDVHDVGGLCVWITLTLGC